MSLALFRWNFEMSSPLDKSLFFFMKNKPKIKVEMQLYLSKCNSRSISSQLECILQPVKQLVCEFTDILE